MGGRPGVSVFMVSWRSADESTAGVTWDDYVRAQIEAIDAVRARLGVPSVHVIGYCVAGTTLAATLAILARRGEADKVKSATFLTAQVDFQRAGDLRLFVDDTQLELIRQASNGGYLDGRYMAATFNLLRGTDLIWNTVINHYLLGEDYPAFDLLHWNGDVTNLPALWHEAYLRDLYRDNLLVTPDALAADGTPIDLGRIATPAYVQAGREDHIAPPESVYRMLAHLDGAGALRARRQRAHRRGGQSAGGGQVPVLDRRAGLHARGFRPPSRGASGQLVDRLADVAANAGSADRPGERQARARRPG